MGDFKVNSTVFELKLDGRQIKRSVGSDVGDIVNKIMLVTLSLRLIKDVDSKIIMKAIFRDVGVFSLIKLLILNRSSASQTCHQHVSFPIFVSNIDVTSLKSELFLF